ncbi:MAG TPA: RNA polymerase sigma factor [Candidatus Limnocylindrales bacterium]|nr:RNA polymerase sigma factor [Candidatus Limnocylindrales bacterium]
MTRGLDLGGQRSDAAAYRLAVADFGAFYEQTYQAAYRTALGIVRDSALAADVTQDAYVSAYRHRSRFRGDAPAQAWLHRIVVNTALAAMRRRRHVEQIPAASLSTAADASSGAIARLVVTDALDRIPPRQRAAVVLRYYHDYDYATIAQILGTTSSNVGAILTRSLDRLQAAIERGGAARGGAVSHE